MFPDPTALYTERLARYNAAQERLEQHSRRVGNLNLFLLLVAFAVLALAAFRSDSWLVALAVLLFVIFVGGLVMHHRVNRKLQTVSLRAGLNRDGLARLARDWKALPAPLTESSSAPTPVGAIDPATAADLDLTGYASLAQLLGTPHTPIGKRTVQRWILTPASPATVCARQQSCAELAPQIDFREEVGVRGRLLESDEERYAQFVAWAEGERWLHAHRHWLWVARLLPLAVLSLFVALLVGYPVLAPLLGLLLINLFVLQSVGRKVGDAISRVAAQQGEGTHPAQHEGRGVVRERRQGAGIRLEGFHGERPFGSIEGAPSFLLVGPPGAGCPEAGPPAACLTRASSGAAGRSRPG